MYDVAFQNVLPLWDEVSSTIPEPLGSDMDYVRMMFNESSSNNCMVDLTGLENNILDMDCGHCILEDFQITEVPELLIENNGARSGNLGKPISDEPSKESCLNSETVISSYVSFQDSGSEAISMFGMPSQHCGDTYLPPCHDEIGAAQEELSTLAEDTLIYGASNFGVDCFLLSNDGPFACSSTTNHERAKDTDRKCVNFESVVSIIEPSVGRIDARRGQESMYTVSAPVRGRARSKRSRSIAWSNSCVNWSNFPTNYTLDSAPALSSYTTFCPTPTNSLDSTSDFSSVTTTNVWYPSSELGSWATTKSPTDESCPTSMQSTMPADEFQIAAQEAKSKISSTHKRKKGEENGQPRRCTHCLSQKTPQWRAGPGGPKTLCNACGVRFKSGRLFPEYRPAKSPTFLSDKHSNSHRKVLELRGRWNFPR